MKVDVRAKQTGVLHFAEHVIRQTNKLKVPLGEGNHLSLFADAAALEQHQQLEFRVAIERAHHHTA